MEAKVSAIPVALIIAILISFAAVSECQEHPLSFPVSFFKALAKKRPAGSNIAVSPFSANTGLTMAFLGAAGDTKKELATALGISETDSASSLSAQYLAVSAPMAFFTLRKANDVYVEKTFAVKSDYQANLQRLFSAQVEPADFEGNFEAERVKINAAVEVKTNNKIKNLLPPKSLSRDIKLVLVNALYFKADWEKKFDEENTKQEAFTLANGQTKMVPLMKHAEAQFPYTELRDLGFAQVVELKYKMGHVSMFLILPRADSSIDDVQSKLTPAGLETAFLRLRERPVEVVIPRFKVNIGSDLKEVLMNMGVNLAFNRDAAQFSGVSAEQLYISKVQHQVFLEVDEKGTVGGAATGVVNDGARSLATNFVFRADRPFLFVIRHKQSKAILFMGRVSDPTVEN